MNAVTASIFWMTVQIAVFSLLGIAAYQILRRRGPKAAATCAATVLALTLPLAVLVASPWPSWIAHQPEASTRLHEPDAHPRLAANRSSRSQSAQPEDAESVVDPSLAGSEDSALAMWWQTASEWANSTGTFAADHERPAWQAWLPWLLAAGIGFGIVRLAAGMWSISRLRRSSRLINDEGVLAQVRELAARFDSTIVELRESPAL